MDKKNIFEKNKTGGKKAIYYGLMALCIIAIAAVSFISYKSAQDALSDNKIENSIDNVDTVDTELENITETETDNQEQIQDSEKTAAQSESVKNEQPAVESKEYIMPVSGEITAEFSLTEPIYSQTLKDWRIHDGIDISANLGDNVVCVNDGVIESIRVDDLFGVVVTVKHTDGKKSVYSNLDDTIELEEGQIINQGDIIGKIGQSAIFEIADGPHLHFEISENGNKIDPKTVIKVQE